MLVGLDEHCPLPDEPILSEAAVALSEAGHAAWILDADWRLVYVTDEYRLSAGGFGRLAPVVVGKPVFGAETLAVAEEWMFGPNNAETLAATLADLGGLMLADVDGDRARLRSVVDESLH
jgi:hypothetical protein